MPVIAVAHSKGGCGKTTTCYNLICCMLPSLAIDWDIHGGISVLNSIRSEAGPLHIVNPQNIPEMLKLVQGYDEKGELVIIDCGGFDSDATRAAVAIADLVLVPASDTITERIGLSIFDATLEKVSQSIGRDIQAKLVICKTHPAKKNFPKLDAVLEQTKHVSRLKSVISNRPDHHECHEYGMGVTERLATRHTAAGKEILALVEEINALLAEAA